MKYFKKFKYILLIIIVLCPIIAIAWDYSGTGSGGPGASSSGSWNDFVVGVRATAVDKNGKRLTVEADGRTYTSKSIDYFGSVAQVTNGYRARVATSNEHSNCNGRLCSKPELESGGFNSQHGGYSYEQWPYQGISALALPVGVSLDSTATVNKLVSATRNFENYEDQANDLFQRLMGQPITYFQENSTGDCEELREKLAEAFIIFEPLAQMSSYTGTASEIAIMYHNNNNQKYGTVPKLYNALRVDPAVGNRGLVYFNGVNAMPTYTNATLSATQAAINNTHQGYGVAILAYGPKFVEDSSTWACDYDYSYTAACATCDNTNSDYLAYTIKDTSDWNAIMASGNSSYSDVAGYFNDGSYPTGDSQDPEGEAMCREEFSVYFPNQLSQIYVEPGRYFIMYPDDTSGMESVGASAIPNLKPYKVYRKRECKAEVHLWQKEKESYSAFLARVLAAKRRVLQGYETDKKEDFASDMGKVWFRYNETYKDSKYNMDEPDELDRYQIYKDNIFTAYKNKLESIAADDALLTMENTNEYELPDGYYQYVRLKDGLSVTMSPSANVDQSKYKNLGIANLPVSYENHGVKINATQYKAADIQFAYDLPENAMLGKAASGEVSLATSIGSGGSGGNCISKETILGDPTSGYSCKVLTSTLPTGDDDDDDDDDDSGCRTEADANRLGVDWDPVHGKCCKVGQTYNEKTKKCEPDGSPGDDDDDDDDNGGGCKTEADANRLGVDWNPMTKSCCAKGTTYNPSKGKCVPGNNDNTTDPVCPTSTCPYGCCPSGECAPMPDGTCPGSGNIDIIYRTIDLEDPFPGQNAENRETGSNWCSYNIKTQKIDCNYNNQTVKNYITRERSSKKNGYKVYDDDHVLYEVTLDSKTVSSIRSYNDGHKYDDDWIESCYGNGKACTSKFLKEYSSVITGKCKNTSLSNFYTCDKDV